MSKSAEVALRAQTLKGPYCVTWWRCADDQTFASKTRHAPPKGDSMSCIPWKSQTLEKWSMVCHPPHQSISRKNWTSTSLLWGGTGGWPGMGCMPTWHVLNTDYTWSHVALQELHFFTWSKGPTSDNGSEYLESRLFWNHDFPNYLT